MTKFLRSAIVDSIIKLNYDTELRLALKTGLSQAEAEVVAGLAADETYDKLTRRPE